MTGCAPAAPAMRTPHVLRVDVAMNPGFPNGRALSGPAVASGKEEDVTDVEFLRGLVKIANVYTRVAQTVCGVA